jgi:plastocyanin
MTGVKVLRRVASASVCGIAGIALVGFATAIAKDQAVKIVDFGFSPKSITIRAGETVTWTNTGARDHTVTAVDGSFDSGTLSSGDAYANVFHVPGAFRYRCEIHPTRMTGTVIVEAAPKTPTPSGSSPPTPPPGTIPPSFFATPPASPEPASATPVTSQPPIQPAPNSESLPALLVVGAVILAACVALFVMRGRRSTG